MVQHDGADPHLKKPKKHDKASRLPAGEANQSVNDSFIHKMRKNLLLNIRKHKVGRVLSDVIRLHVKERDLWYDKILPSWVLSRAAW